jgi:carbamoyltransferase
MLVLGLHDGHNATACLIEDGNVVFCLQEERINGIKNFNGFPHHAMQRALQWANLTVEDLDIFALGALHNPAWKDAQELIKQYSAPQWKKNLTDFFKVSPLFRLYKSIKAGQRKKFLINAGIPINKIRYYHHHTSHAAAALYSSGFEKVPSLILTLDGGGDDVCAGVYSSEEGNLSCIKTTREGHSVGNIYGNSTFYMGMSPLEHEYKLMGMAPYSQTKYFTKISQSLDGLLDVNGLQFKRTTLSTTSNCYHHLERIYQRQRFDAICGGLQDFAERKVLRWVKNAIH